MYNGCRKRYVQHAQAIIDQRRIADYDDIFRELCIRERGAELRTDASGLSCSNYERLIDRKSLDTRVDESLISHAL